MHPAGRKNYGRIQKDQGVVLLRSEPVRDDRASGRYASLPLLELPAAAWRGLRHALDLSARRLSLDQGRRPADLQQFGPDSSQPMQELRLAAHRRYRPDA